MMKCMGFRVQGAGPPIAPTINGSKNENLDQLSRQSKEAEQYFRRTGITFSVHGDETDTERLIPFDVIPRIISSKEWELLERRETTRFSYKYVFKRYL